MAAALAVAALAARPQPDFPACPVVAVLRDGAAHPVWALRLAAAAREIAARRLRPEAAPAEGAYQLWLWPRGAAAPRSLGLLPMHRGTPMPLTPAAARLLAGAGRLAVTLEPARGSAAPSGPVLFAGTIRDAVKNL